MAEGLELIVKTLTDYGKLGVMALRQAVEKYSATGKTADSIRFEVSIAKTVNIILAFFGRAFFKAIETGRGPRKSSTYGEFDLNLEEYLQARGIQSKTSKSGIEYFKIGKSWVSAKSLAHKINTEGDSIFKKGGRVVYSPTLTNLVSEIKLAVGQNFRSNYVKEILK